jgi:Glycosyl transferase family 2
VGADEQTSEAWMTDTELPTVSVLMPAYNYADYIGRALESALKQDYPAELLQIVVVDDGSVDGTAAVVSELADRHPGRIQLISQANAGPSAAINRALEAATGVMIAVLDADDMWLPAKTRRQVDALRADHTLGMVFCDMTVVDGEEKVVRPSQVGNIGDFPRRAFARLLCQNVATQSSILVRRELTRPIPREIPYSDWWFALRAAEVADVLYIPEPLALYREHGANLTSGVSGDAGIREHRKEITFQLWALRNLKIDSLAADEMSLVWAGVEEHARRAMAMAGSYFVELISIEPEASERSIALAAQAEVAAAAGDHRQESVLLLRALANDPFAHGLKTRLMQAVEARRAG